MDDRAKFCILQNNTSWIGHVTRYFRRDCINVPGADRLDMFLRYMNQVTMCRMGDYRTQYTINFSKSDYIVDLLVDNRW